MDDKEIVWARRYIDLARSVAGWSKKGTKVGAYIATNIHTPVSHGFNGIPRGVNDTICDRHVRPLSQYFYEHAERNAIYNSFKGDMSDCTMYVTHHACSGCARAIIQNRIRHVVVDGRNSMANNVEFYKKWKYDCDLASDMFNEAGVIVDILEE